MEETIRERLIRNDPSLWGEDEEALNNGTPVHYIKIDIDGFIIISSFRHKGELMYIISVDGRKVGSIYVVQPDDIIV